MNRPNTTMGRALAARALDLSGRQVVLPERPASMIDLTTPEQLTPAGHIREAAKAALDRGETHYTARPGIPQLCAAIARRSTEDGYLATPTGTVVTNGGAEALYIALQSTLSPGDTLLAGTPIAPNVVEMVEFIGARVQRLALDGERFAPDARDIRREDGKVLLLASPSPITGFAISPNDLARLIAAAVEREITVILDRTLAWCCFDPALARFPDASLAAQVHTTGSFSTAYAMSGWRVGYFTARAEHLGNMLELKQAMSICTSGISQFAALAALAGPDTWLAERHVTLTARRDALIAALEACGHTAIVPDAWPPMLLDMRWVDADDEVVARRMASEDRMLIEPASRYSDALRGLVRIRLDVSQSAFDTFLARVQGT